MRTSSRLPISCTRREVCSDHDGANANAILGISRAGDMGFDVVHYNLHKTFSTPHGGGGPGAGPVAVTEKLAPYLPVPVVVKKEDGQYALDYDRPHSIGSVKAFYGNFGVLVKAYTYIRALGPNGLRRVSEIAVLNANYLMHKLKPYYDLPYNRTCKHEFVLSGNRQKQHGVRTLDILHTGSWHPCAYRLLPLIVDEAIMIEPTETESLETDAFVEAMISITHEAENDPEVVKAPHNQVGRLTRLERPGNPIWLGVRPPVTERRGCFGWPGSQRHNMAIDEALLKRLGGLSCACTAGSPVRSLGLLPRCPDRGFRTLCSRGHRLVRRPTGGRAICMPRTHLFGCPSPQHRFAQVGVASHLLSAGAKSLTLLGLGAQLAKSPHRGSGVHHRGKARPHWRQPV